MKKISEYVLEKVCGEKRYFIDLRNMKIFCYNGLSLDESLLVSESEDEYFVEKSKYLTSLSRDNSLDIEIITTFDCNFDCIYCYQKKNVKISLTTKNIDKIYAFITKTLLKYQLKNLCINWFGGEPLLKLKEIRELSTRLKIFCASQGIPFIASITTNGYLLSIDTFKELLKLNIRYYQVTLDGDRESHNRFRPHVGGGGTYDKILSNLVIIKQSKIKSFFQIAIRCNVMRDTINNFEEMIHVFNLCFLEDQRFILNPYYVRDWGGQQVNKSTLEKNFLNDGDIEIKLESNYYSLFRQDSGERGCFSAYKYGMSIIPELGVFKCSHYVDMQDNYLGNIFSDVQRNIKYKCYKKNVCVDDCKNCKYYPFCIRYSCPIKKTSVESSSCKDLANRKIEFEFQKFLKSVKYEKNSIIY